MAQRRMFSPDIVESEEFLDMPHSSQSLYFHLAMRADDDGFIQPKMIMRTIGANSDDLKVLLTKRFLLSFESGVVVVKHWLIHNMIRADRYKPSRFQKEKELLYLKDNKSYTDAENKGISLMATKCQPDGNQMAPQVRLGKVSTCESEDSRGQSKKKKPDFVVVPTTDDGEEIQRAKPQSTTRDAPKVFTLFKEVLGNYPPAWVRNKTERAAAQSLYDTKGIDKIRKALAFYREYRDDTYIPEVFTPDKLEKKWDALAHYKNKKGL